MLLSCLAVHGLATPGVSRRSVIGGVAAIGALPLPAIAQESARDHALLPAGAVAEIEAGRAVVIPNWLPAEELAALRADATALHDAGNFNLDALATYSLRQKGTLDKEYDRMTMASFSSSKGTDGPWSDWKLGDGAARKRFKARITELRETLAVSMHDRPTLAASTEHTHEASYSRYGPGARLPRHTDEHHAELKKAHSVASGDENIKRLGRASSGPVVGTRRSVTWLVYLNDDDWDSRLDGGQLRVHERAAPSCATVGACGTDLQVGWLRATPQLPEQPVFLDANRAHAHGNCMLYTTLADGSHRDLSAEPFSASPALYLAGGDFFARKLLVDGEADSKRFHLVDAPKSAASALLPPVGASGEDGGERVRDITPLGGTLVLFDSVAIPHQVLPARRRPRLACTGWFHEQMA